MVNTKEDGLGAGNRKSALKISSALKGELRWYHVKASLEDAFLFRRTR